MRRAAMLPPLVVACAPREFFTLTMRPAASETLEWPNSPLVHCMLREFLDEVLEGHPTHGGRLNEYARESREEDVDDEYKGDVIRAIMLIVDFKVCAAIVFAERASLCEVEIICSRGESHEHRLLGRLRAMEALAGKSVFSLHRVVRYTSESPPTPTSDAGSPEDIFALGRHPTSVRFSKSASRLGDQPASPKRRGGGGGGASRKWSVAPLP